MSFRKILATSICGTLVVASSFAAEPQQQNQQRPPQPPVNAQVGQRTVWQNSDHMLATCVAIGNQEEVILSKFAGDKAKDQDVKDFAKMMVKDHQAFLQKLQRFAPEATREGYLNENTTAEAGQRTSATQPNRDVNVNAGKVNVKVGNIQQTAGVREEAPGQQWQHVDFMALHRELAENCIRQAKEGMSKKQGNEFDECFIGHQIAAHEQMKNKLTVFQRHTTGELNQVFAEGLSTTEKHLKRAEELMKKLNETSSNSKSRS